MGKIVDNNHYHIWTDALHAAALARESINKWDRGTYVRWGITSAWIALEVACQDALNNNNISYSFQKNINESISQGDFQKINWGCGVWQRVKAVQELRKNYVHRFSTENELYPSHTIAQDAIDTIRSAIKDIYKIVNKPVPVWVDDNADKGFDKSPSFEGHLTCTEKGADKNNPECFVLSYITKGKEYDSLITLSHSSICREIENIKINSTVPIDSIIVRKGSEIVEEYKLKMRGGA